MKEQNYTFIEKIERIFLSFFGSGYAPKAPGTVGSLATIPLIYLLSYLNINLIALIIIITIGTIYSSIVTEKFQNKFGLHDPQWIVIDEVLGMLVTWCFVFKDTSALNILIVFITFRFFDIIKFWPASYFDKKVKHGLGVIVDDIISGLFAGISTYLIINFFINA